MTIQQKITKTLSGKKVLFLENDSSLDNGVDKFEDVLKSSNIEYTGYV